MTLLETLDSPKTHLTTAATFHDLMASIGYLLFQWSLLDRSLDEEIAHLRRAGGGVIALPCRARTVNERLAEWRALIGRGRRRFTDHQAIDSVGMRIQDYQRLRNLISGGFVSASAEADEPSICCAHATSRQGITDEVRMTTADILQAIDAMELCRTEMTLLRDLSGR